MRAYLIGGALLLLLAALAYGQYQRAERYKSDYRAAFQAAKDNAEALDRLRHQRARDEAAVTKRVQQERASREAVEGELRRFRNAAKNIGGCLHERVHPIVDGLLGPAGEKGGGASAAPGGADAGPSGSEVGAGRHISGLGRARAETRGVGRGVRDGQGSPAGVAR